MDELREIGFEICDFCVALRLRLSGDMEVATLHALLDLRLSEWRKRLEAAGLEKKAADLWTLWLGLIENVIEHSPWNHSLACAYCRDELKMFRVPAGTLDQKIRELIDPQRENELVTLIGKAELAELYFYISSLRANEPYVDVRRVRQRNAERLLAVMEHEIDCKRAMSEPLSPEATADPLRERDQLLDIPRELPIEPMGPSGQKWEIIRDFYFQNQMDDYEIPWYLMVGEVNTGKTALLINPELDVECITDDGITEGISYVVEGWFERDKALILNVPGLYTRTDASSADAAQWHHLLDLVRTHRRKRPLDGVILAVSMEDLLTSEDDSDKRARHLSGVLQQIYRRAGCRLPVYVILTKADRIYGFVPFARALSTNEDQRNGAFGWSVTGDVESGFSPERFADAFTAMVERVRGFRPWLLPSIEDSDDLLAAYAFADELASFEGRLEKFLGRMLAQFGAEPTFFFRGFYFVSMEQGRIAMARHYNHHEPYEEVPVSPSDDNFFLRDVFEEKIFVERGLVRRSINPEDTQTVTQPISRWKTILKAAIALFLLLGAIWIAYRIYEIERILTIETEFGEFAFIPYGTFTMGSPATDELRYPDETPHEVYINRPFYLGKTEVTQGTWSKIFNAVDQNPSRYQGRTFPVDSVTWIRAEEFTRLASRADPTGSYELPTESQWEYAARAGTRSALPDNLEGRTWFEENAKMTTHEVASLAPNEWGLYDMNGNVPEWCLDWYDPVYPPSVAVNPVNLEPGLKRVLRGGAFYDQIRPLRPANRDYVLPDNASKISGFRLVYQPDTSPYDATDLPTIQAYFYAKVWMRQNQKEIWRWIESLWGGTGDLWNSGTELLEDTLSGNSSS